MQSYLLGKTLLYFLNAYNDAYIAQQLANKYKGEGHSIDSRCSEYIELCSGNSSLLLGVVYSQYFMNGFYDFMFARLLFLFLNVDNKVYVKNKLKDFETTFDLVPYTEFESDQITLISPIIVLLFGKLPYRHTFKTVFGLSNVLELNVAIKGMLLVQEHNIKSNMQYLNKLSQDLELLKLSEDKKDKLLYLILKDAYFDSIKILNHIKSTLVAASQWDRLFQFILKVRFKTF